MKPASIFKRMVAFFIDYTILSILLFIVGSILSKLTPDSSSMLDSAREVFQNALRHFVPDHSPSLSARLASNLVFYTTHMKSTVVICIALAFIYFVYFEHSKRQGTIGKSLLKLQVVGLKNKPISILNAVIRFTIFAAPALLLHFVVFFMHPECLNFHLNLLQASMESPALCISLFTGYGILYAIWLLPAFFTKERSTLYDLLSKTKVRG